MHWVPVPLRYLLAALAVLIGISAVSMATERPLNERVLVVYNPDVRSSKQVAQHYLEKRSVPRANLCAIKPGRGYTWDTSDSVPYADFRAVVLDPIRTCLKKVGRDNILYIVLAYGMPFTIGDVPSGEGRALDQRLVDIWQTLNDSPPTPNPYYAGVQAKLGIYPDFVPLSMFRAKANAKPLYSVWRLDGATAAIASGLVDQAIEAEQHGLHGLACIDRRYGPKLTDLEDTSYNSGDWALYRAAQFLRDAGITVLEDSHEAEFGTPPAPLRCDHAIFYAGWYALNHYNDAFRWETGAIGMHLDSASAAHPRRGENWSANALARGITVTSGAVDEPFLPGLPRVDGIVHDLLAGANVGDAFLRNTQTLNWMIINIGDPLYRPPLHRKAKPGS